MRHGRSAHAESRWLDHASLPLWFEAYDRAGLAAGERPPAALIEMASSAGALVASDLPRAVESARLLAAGRAFAQSPLLREVSQPFPRIPVVRLPVLAWGLMMAPIWFRQMRRERVDGDLPNRRQALQAAEYLQQLARQHGSVMAVTHGALRYYVRDALLHHGWSCAEPRSSRNWSVWSFSRDGQVTV